MMAADGQLKDLSLELERINQDYAIAPAPITVAPVPINLTPATTMPVTDAPANQVTNVRFGKNGAATRVVLDLAQRSQYTTDLDNANGVLVVMFLLQIGPFLNFQ